MGRLIRMSKGYYSNKNAVENAIRYITRTRFNEPDRGSLIYFSAAGADMSRPDFMIHQFLQVQKTFKGSDTPQGRKIYHEVFSLYESDMEHLNYDMEKLKAFARQCAEYYNSLGFQVVYAIHAKDNGASSDNSIFHIHFVVNAVNYIDGRKWHSNGRDSGLRNQLFNEMLSEYFIK